ncbi:MAG: hypothetical protein KTR18_10835 [Acidiferrobacterales bacterium]|nr:hypothetical protein [Acidiferrobacterales bacterium]
MEKLNSTRRTFVKTCVTAASAVAANPRLLASSAPVRSYHRSLIVDENGEPIGSNALKADKPFIFHYPFVTTPCFLVNLGKPLIAGRTLQSATQGSYTWQGGAGPENQIVAFSAICTHKLSYPTKTMSFLNYRSEKVRFVSHNQGTLEQRQLIYCCSERSAYDPANGAEVLGGPATQPLAAVELEYESSTDRYYATGTRGGELYDSFFEKFGFRLALDHKVVDVRASVSDQTLAVPHDLYSSNTVSC